MAIMLEHPVYWQAASNLCRQRQTARCRDFTCYILALCKLEHILYPVNDLETAIWRQLAHIARVKVPVAVCTHSAVLSA